MLIHYPLETMLPNYLKPSPKAYQERPKPSAARLAVKAKQCGCPTNIIFYTDSPSPSELLKRSKCNARKRAKDPPKIHGVPIEASKASATLPLGLTHDQGPILSIRVDYTAICSNLIVKVLGLSVNALCIAIDLHYQHDGIFTASLKALLVPFNGANER